MVFRTGREYVPVGLREKHPVFHDPKNHSRGETLTVLSMGAPKRALFQRAPDLLERSADSIGTDSLWLGSRPSGNVKKQGCFFP
jgi:hypothetical protein